MKKYFFITLFILGIFTNGYSTICEVHNLDSKHYFFVNDTNIAEYFIDTDPGVGYGTPIIMTTIIDSINFKNIVIPPGVVANGKHYMYVRTRDSKKIWLLHEPISIQIENTLPIEWLGFKAIKNEKNVDLNWSIASESNCLKYEIERTTDQKGFDTSQFHTIGTVNGGGTISTTSNYHFSDKNVNYKGINYYRMKQINADGKISYSVIHSVDFSNTASIRIYPKQNSKEYVLDITDEGIYDIDVSIFNAKGKEVTNYKNTSPFFHFGNDLESGIYFIHVTVNQKKSIYKIVKVD